VARQIRAHLGYCGGHGISGGSVGSTFRVAFCQPLVDAFWPPLEPVHQPRRHGYLVLSGDYSDSDRRPLVQQQFVSRAFRPRASKLLDRPETAWSTPGNDGAAVLGGIVSFLAELWDFLRVRKKLWLVPVIALMLIFGTLLILAQSSAVAPFIYTLF